MQALVILIILVSLITILVVNKKYTGEFIFMGYNEYLVEVYRVGIEEKYNQLVYVNDCIFKNESEALRYIIYSERQGYKCKLIINRNRVNEI